MTEHFWQGLLQAWFVLGLVFAVVAWFVAKLSVQYRLARQQLLQSARLAAIGEAMTALAHESRNALQRSQSGLEMLTKRVRGDADALGLLAEVNDAQRYLTDLYVSETYSPRRASQSELLRARQAWLRLHSLFLKSVFLRLRPWGRREDEQDTEEW